MRIFTRKTLREYWEQKPETRKPLSAWYSNAEKAKWMNPLDVLTEYSNASVVDGTKFIFRFRAGYRLVVDINFETQCIFILFLGDHDEYDRMDIHKL